MFKIIAINAAISGLLTFPITAFADAKSEISTAAQHAGFAAAAPNLLQTRMHLHHVLNCLVGPRDADFDKTKAERGQVFSRRPVLIKPCGEADGVGEAESAAPQFSERRARETARSDFSR